MLPLACEDDVIIDALAALSFVSQMDEIGLSIAFPATLDRLYIISNPSQASSKQQGSPSRQT